MSLCFIFVLLKKIFYRIGESKRFFSSKKKSWQNIQIDVPSTLTEWKVVFAATKGNATSGILAIDDVRVTKGLCPNLGDCDFEDGKEERERHLKSDICN